MGEIERLRKRVAELEAENKRLRESKESTETVTVAEVFKGHPVLLFKGHFHPFRLGLRKVTALLELIPMVRHFVETEGRYLSPGLTSAASGTVSASIGDYKGHSLLKVSGAFRPFSLGAGKLSRVLEALPSVREFAIANGWQDTASAEESAESTGGLGGAMADAVIKLALVMAQADGVVHSTEIACIREEARKRQGARSAGKRARVDEALAMLRSGDVDADALAEELAEVLSEAERAELVEHLFEVAVADGVFHEAEEVLLRDLAPALGVEPSLLDEVFAAWNAGSESGQAPSRATSPVRREASSSGRLGFLDEALDMLTEGVEGEPTRPRLQIKARPTEKAKPQPARPRRVSRTKTPNRTTSATVSRVSQQAPNGFDGGWIRQHRNRLGFTQTDLAALIGAGSSGTISHWETGKKLPSSSEWAALAKVLDPGLPNPLAQVTGDWLMARRKKARLSRDKLAAAIHCTVSEIAAHEEGNKELAPRLKRKALRRFDRSAS
jgi:DNA-binding transcriptional regulator YiaG/uncharacterized tellurite resistance protein B-like protein